MAIPVSAPALLPQAPALEDEIALPIGVLDLFKIGIGPSSSHTIGPMKAANAFIAELPSALLSATSRIAVTLFGSLAWTGLGHATDKAVTLGLMGHRPELIDPDAAREVIAAVQATHHITLPGGRAILFNPAWDILFDKTESFARHPNALRFAAFDAQDGMLHQALWFSIGGGFIEREGTAPAPSTSPPACGFAYHDSNALLALCEAHGCQIASLALANECARRGLDEALHEIDHIIETMLACIERGLNQSGPLPGPFKVQRRARALYQKATCNTPSASEYFNHISAFAIAVNEENAAGGRVVTAPTNGAAGVVPAVLRYYRDFCTGADQEGMRIFLLTATAIGGIIKRNASISGAEVGCQGEVGSAAAMAAAGLTAALGGSNAQIENAAEIAMEHHLGMTCDPIGGLVQIPCIERNAFGAIKAVNAAYLALAGDGKHLVSLDQVIETMRQTGLDMNDKYRETSRGGLAINVPEC